MVRRNRIYGLSGAAKQSHLQKRLTIEQEKAIIQRYCEGETFVSLAMRYNFQSASAINDILRRHKILSNKTRSGQWINKHRCARGECASGNKLTWQMVLCIVGLVRAGYSHKLVAAQTDCTKSTVGRILQGENWSWLTGIQPRPPVASPPAVEPASDPAVDADDIHRRWAWKGRAG